ncbi:hypothetical protein [Sinomicrobium sp.]
MSYKLSYRRGHGLKSLPTTLLLFVLLAVNTVFAQERTIEATDWKAGEVLFDTQKWTEVIVGDMPLVISVPHGGYFEDENIPDRECSDKGRVVTVSDANTIATARAVQQVFRERYNKTPYIVISRLSRRKVDQNREVDLATCGNALGIQAWNNFHNAVDRAIKYAQKDSEWVLYIDLHGHGHKNQRLEIGYNMTSEELEKAYKKDGLKKLTQKSSLRNLVSEKGTDFHSLLFGADAFGTLMQNRGIAATPAMQDPHPVEGEKFFSGGDNTRMYTSSEYPKVFGWQIECNYKGVRNSDASRVRFGEAFAASYMEYISKLAL